MPPTEAQVEEQIQLEREQIRRGLERLKDTTKKLEDKAYASATVYGATSIETLLPLVSTQIEATISRLRRGQNGPVFKEIHNHIADIDTNVLAAISSKVTFDHVFSHRDNDNFLANVCMGIGGAIEAECQIRYYEKAAPDLLNYIRVKYWHKSSGTKQKLQLTKTLFNKKEDIPQWKSWGPTVKVKLGAWLLEVIMEVSGWFTKTIIYTKKKKQTVVVPTPAFLEIKDTVMTNAELFSPLCWPMVIEPNEWGPDKRGGYLLNEVMRGHALVRRGNPLLELGGEIYDFINTIQRTAYTVNQFIYGVAKHLDAKGIAVGKFIPIVEVPLPPKPVDIAENYDSRKDYRRKAAEAMNLNAYAFRRSCRTRAIMETLKVFHTKEKFYIPWSFDYRGRAYPIAPFLTPQDTDFGKSLLRFYEESFITPDAEEWLAFQVATTYGLDKSTMSERLAWTKENAALITRVATDPIDNLGDWEAADEPWQFLAACDEYYHCIIACDRHHTGLPVATDATCSGLQILAGLARDASTARLVNVLPSPTPQDAYKVIAEAAKPHCPESIQPYMDRKVVKRVVMTVPYNAKPYSNRQYIRDALKEKNVEISTEDLTLTVTAVREAMERVVPGPMAVMRWIESEVGKAIKRGENYLEWTTPSGFVVQQKLMKRNVVQVELKLLGRCRISVYDGDTDQVDLLHHKNATAPNLIHSLDASLLHLSALKFDAPIALIHDSVLCRATDMSQLSNVVRETYMHLFAEHDCLMDFARTIDAETPPPIIGDLEPESVIDSTYFFC